jgi:hypothetical protein
MGGRIFASDGVVANTVHNGLTFFADEIEMLANLYDICVEKRDDRVEV